jgi:hypothetical protein
MTIKAANISIESAFATQWGSRTPILYAEVPYAPQTGEHVKIEVMPETATRKNLGQTDVFFRFHGVIVISIFVPQGTGTARIRELADAATDIFLGRKIDSVKIYNVDMTRDAYDGWLVWKLFFNTKRDEIFND